MSLLSNWDHIKDNLSHANLSNANLSYANLSDANLARANLSGANLYRSNLLHAHLDSANLSHANLSHANLSYVNLFNANLSDAHLCGVVGNGKEVKSMQLGEFPIVYTKDIMAIGCEQHSIEDWKTLEGINLSENNLKSWQENKNFIFNIINRYPAI